MASEFDRKLESYIMRCSEEIECEINKDELIKALNYDRNQYEKGYADGVKESEDKWISVYDELPKKRYKGQIQESVIVYTEDKLVMSTLYNFDDSTIDIFPSRFQTCHSVTHWMLAPKPPKPTKEQILCKCLNRYA